MEVLGSLGHFSSYHPDLDHLGSRKTGVTKCCCRIHYNSILEDNVKFETVWDKNAVLGILILATRQFWAFRP